MNCMNSIEKRIYEEQKMKGFIDIYEEMWKRTLYHHNNCKDEFLENMKLKADNRAFRNIKNNNSIMSLTIALIKKIIRKFIKWYIEPIADQQSDFNHNTCACIENLERRIDELERKIEIYIK